MSWFGESFEDSPDSDPGLADDLDEAFDKWSTEVEEEFLGRDSDEKETSE